MQNKNLNKIFKQRNDINKESFQLNKLDFKEFLFMSAPMEDMTSNSFRTICFQNGADVTFTELVRIQSLARNNKSTWDRIVAHDSTPTIIQLIGTDEKGLKKIMKDFKPFPGFMGFNLNCGCPAPSFVNNGMGCAMMKRIQKIRKLVAIVKEAGYPISIKMRLGLNKYEKEKKVYMNILDGVNADFFIIHARHGGESYEEKPDYSIYPECVKTGKIIVANGDFNTQEKIDFLKSIGVKGVMIGKSAINDPTIFNKLKGNISKDIETITKDYIALTEKYDEPFRYRKNIQKRLGKKEFFSGREASVLL